MAHKHKFPNICEHLCNFHLSLVLSYSVSSKQNVNSLWRWDWQLTITVKLSSVKTAKNLNISLLDEISEPLGI